MHSVAVAAAATGVASLSVVAGKRQSALRISTNNNNNNNNVAGLRRHRHRPSLASAQPLSAQTYTSDILKASAVQAPSGAVVPGLSEDQEVPKVVALKSVSSSPANVSSNAAAAGEDDAEQPPHAPLRSPTSPLINWLPRTRWPRGIPVVMGAHLLASHGVAPISVSKGPGIDVTPHQFQYQVSAEEDEAATSTSTDLTAEVSASVHGSPGALAAALATSLLEAAAAAISARGHFALAVSGGSVLDLLSEGLKGKNVDFSKWTVALADERLVSSDDNDSNLKAARAALPSLFSSSARVILPFTETSGGTSGAATEFEGALRRLSPSVLPRREIGNGNGGGGEDENLPVFDAIVLGLGPDGHVASLFPNHPSTAIADGRWVVPVEQAPRSPPRRVSLSLPVLRAAREVFVAASGLGKASAVQRALEVQALPGAVPAQMLRPLSSSDGGSRVRWMVDVDAGSLLRPQTWEDGKAWPRSAV